MPTDLHDRFLIGLLVVLSSRWLSSEHVNPYNFINILTSQPCEPGTDLIIVVHSAVNNSYSHRRTMLRSSWLNPAQLRSRLGLRLKVIFMLGSSVDPVEQNYAEYESEMYGDIVQYSFIDDYQNNTYKAMSYLSATIYNNMQLNAADRRYGFMCIDTSIMGGGCWVIGWVSNNCANASLIMKMDDDVLLKESQFDNLYALIYRLKDSKYPVYAGRKIDNIPNRNKESKWYIPYSVYPDKFYPVWYQGLVYFLSPSLASDLFYTALDTTYMFTDDVYVGITVNKLKVYRTIRRISLTHLSTFNNPLESEADASWEKIWREDTSSLFHVPNATQFWTWYVGQSSNNSNLTLS